MDSTDIKYMDDDFIFDDKKSTKIEKIDIEEEINNDIRQQTYSVFDNINKIQNDLKKRNNEINLLNLKYESLENEYKVLKKQYEKEIDNYKNINTELKNTKKELIEKEKKVLMLKTLLELLVKNYGIDDISKITRLNMEQINKYLD